MKKLLLFLCFVPLLWACSSDEEEVYIELSEKHVILNLGGYYLLDVKTNIEGDIIWKSSHPEIVAVDNGKIKALSFGTVDITATAKGHSALCVVNVPVIALQAINIKVNSTNLKIGDKVLLSTECVPQESYIEELIWHSSDDAIASVSQDGQVTALSGGQVEISVKEKSSNLSSSIILKIENQVVSKAVSTSKPGELSELISTSEKNVITDLTVNGEINGDDIRFLREMAGSNHVGKSTNGILSNLDLSNSIIVEGGDAYYYPETHGYSVCYTIDNVVGNFMFAYCNSLKKILLPKTANKILDYSFYSCENLVEIGLFDLVKSLGAWVFAGNYSLTTINLPATIKSIGIGSFERCLSLEEIELPNNILKIERATFFNCPLLKVIEIPTSVLEIGDSAFGYCKSLNYINIPDNVVYIGTNAFGECENIEKVTLGVSVNNIESNAFDCINLKELYCNAAIPPSVNGFKNVLYGSCTLYIPQNTYELYYTAKGWRHFEKIIEKQ